MTEFAGDRRKKVIVGVATYNEILNLPTLLDQIKKYLPFADVLVVDDNSPDGTGKLMDEYCLKDSSFHVIHRPSKLGLGSAHLALMDFAMKNNFDYLITMDADFSHDPKYLPMMYDLLEKKGNDFVTGSRYVKGGECKYGLYRKALSLTANWLARFLLRIPLQECTTAYRGHRLGFLNKIDIQSVRSNGYSFMVESLYKISQHTKKLSEFPICFEDRTKGKSKINRMEVLKSIQLLIRLTLKRLFYATDNNL